MLVQQATTPGLEQRVAKLYDFSLDISRHDDDLEFARAGGTIHYVIDENVLELFVNPSENYNYVMRDAPRRSPGHEPTSGELQAMQSALLTGEVLLGGALPGQRTGRCFLTEWHRWEALERVSTFIEQSAKTDVSQLKDAMSRAFRAKAILAEDSDTEEAIDADPYLKPDLERLRERFGLSGDIARRMTRVRATAALLSRDRQSEPMHQLDRLLRLNLEGQLALATEILSSERPNHGKLARDAEIWNRQIRREAEGRAARFHSANRKSRTAIWNDAQSLALVGWISGRLDPRRERVVFVTGDQTVFDAYRRTYENEPERAQAMLRPFLLRRPMQYSTLFSVDDETMGNIKGELFYSLQQLVELPLTPMRMASVAAQELSPDVCFRRHSLTLGRIGREYDRRSYFSDVWKAFGERYRNDQIETVERQIDETERFLNGLSGHLVERRVGEDQRDIISRSVGDLEVREHLVDRYVEQAVDALMTAALEVWLPEAETFFRHAAREGPRTTRRRVPLAIVHDLGNGARSELLKTLDALFEDPVEEGSGGRPVSFGISSSFDIFLGAAAIALHGNDWRLADHFCEVAINAFRHLSRYEGTTDADAAEVHYLAALAKRFRVGDLRLRSMSDVMGAERLFEKAMMLLRATEELAGDAGSGFVSYRAFSERAALCLFHATQLYHFAARSSGHRTLDGMAARARVLFADAGACLTEAMRIEERIGSRYVDPKLHGTPHERLRLQVLVNMTAWAALRPVISPDEPDRPELIRECALAMDRIEESVRQSGSMLFRVEFEAFLSSQGYHRLHHVAILAEATRRLPNARRQAGMLEVDRIGIDLIMRQWFTPREKAG